MVSETPGPAALLAELDVFAEASEAVSGVCWGHYFDGGILLEIPT